MPSVNLPAETYEALKKSATAKGCTPDALAQSVLEAHLADGELTEAEYQRQWDDLLQRVRSRVPSELTAEEIEADVKAATDEVRDERIARGR